MTLLYSITPESTSHTDARRSVVLALDESWTVVDARVAVLWSQCRRTGAELVVACTVPAPQLLAARSRYPGVRFIGAAPGTACAALRRLGIEAASGDIVSLIDARLAAAAPLQRAANDNLRLDVLS